MYEHTGGTLSAGQDLTSWSRETNLTGMPHGTGVSNSSAVFTFPSTGIYRVDFQCYIQKATRVDFVGIVINGSTDGFVSNTTTLTAQYSCIAVNADHNRLTANYIYNVANTSNNKIKFSTSSGSTCGYFEIYATFTKLT
jgi:hypothetical protein